MKIGYRYSTVLLTCFLMFNCGSKKRIITQQGKQKHNTEERIKNKKESTKTTNSIEHNTNKPLKTLGKAELYILKYAPIAKAEMKMHKIPASITLAQGILESAYGKGRLAVEANNHFGIKCHGWTGDKIYHDDDRKQECFRKYKEPELSYKNHSEFLLRKRYAKLFKLKPNDYKGWAKGLRAAGYATDKKYPQKLIQLIERYKLFKYDDEVFGRKKAKQVRRNTAANTHIVEKGDTLFSLSKKYKTTVDAIKDLNNLTSTNLILGQQLKIPN